jgi:hypothetical protein
MSLGGKGGVIAVEEDKPHAAFTADKLPYFAKQNVFFLFCSPYKLQTFEKVRQADNKRLVFLIFNAVDYCFWYF